jgi:energy-coupling factor transporter transmembrane protein EcfT
MAELTLFGYRHGITVLHSMDTRVKLVSLVAVSVASLKAGSISLTLVTLGAVGLMLHCRFSLVQLFRESRYFLVLLAFVVAARSLNLPGDPLVAGLPIPFSLQGLLSGLLVGWRLLLIVLLGLLLTATTRPGCIRLAIEWFFKPIPGLPHEKIGTMVGLLVRFIPMLLTQSREIAAAQRARGIENRKNPVYRMTCLGMALMRRSFVTADRLAMAMEARHYGHGHTPAHWHTTAADWIVLAGVTVLCALMQIV